MPKPLAIRQLLDCSQPEFWERIFRSEDFNHYLYEGLGFEYELQEWNATTGYRRARVWPGHQMPRPLAKVFGERFSYIEEGTFDPVTECYHFRVIPSAMAERIRVNGTVVVEAVSERRLIEAYLVSSTREQYAKNAALVNEYLAGFR